MTEYFFSPFEIYSGLKWLINVLFRRQTQNTILHNAVLSNRFYLEQNGFTANITENRGVG